MKESSTHNWQDYRAHFDKLKDKFDRSRTKVALRKRIVNGIFENMLLAVEMDLGTVVLLIVDHKKGLIRRVALSDTESARGAVRMSLKPFKKIVIPLNDEENIIAKAIRSGEPQITEDWKYLFTPDMPADAARFNQAGAGIESSSVYPLKGRNGDGALIFSYYAPAHTIGERHRAFMRDYADLVSLFI